MNGSNKILLFCLCTTFTSMHMIIGSAPAQELKEQDQTSIEQISRPNLTIKIPFIHHNPIIPTTYQPMVNINLSPSADPVLSPTPNVTNQINRTPPNTPLYFTFTPSSPKQLRMANGDFMQLSESCASIIAPKSPQAPAVLSGKKKSRSPLKLTGNMLPLLLTTYMIIKILNRPVGQ